MDAVNDRSISAQERFRLGSAPKGSAVPGTGTRPSSSDKLKHAPTTRCAATLHTVKAAALRDSR
jgi:hypothetical protein